MRTIIFSAFTFLLVMGTAQAQIKVFNDGNVNIGGNTNHGWYKLELDGHMRLNQAKSLVFFTEDTSHEKPGDLVWQQRLSSGTLVEHGRIWTHSNRLYISTDLPNRWADIRIRHDYGWVGIGRDPHHSLDIHGNARANAFISTSDIRFKRDIEPLQASKNILLQLEGVSYNYTDEIYSQDSYDTLASRRNTINRIPEIENRRHYGFVADDLKKVLPDLVYEDSLGYLSVNYMGIIPFLVEAFQEQQSSIDEQNSKIQEQQSIIDAQSLKIKELASKIDKMESAESKSGSFKSLGATLEDAEESQTFITNAFLYQNNPNPFTYDTEIGYYIPEGANQVTLYVFNLQGKLLITEPIDQTGQGAVTISGTSLDPGMYVYALYIDGQEVDSKRMVLTE